jgi:hypothetical protein
MPLTKTDSLLEKCAADGRTFVQQHHTKRCAGRVPFAVIEAATIGRDVGAYFCAPRIETDKRYVGALQVSRSRRKW